MNIKNGVIKNPPPTPNKPERTPTAKLKKSDEENFRFEMQNAVKRVSNQISGFDRKDAILTAAETRSSSPLRINRKSSYQSPSIEGLYPAGEGAGYAGGILSAAVDGLRVAEAVNINIESSL